MRRITVYALTAVISAAAPAAASTIVETFNFSGNNIGGEPTEIFGDGFNPAFGTLTGVEITAQGTYTPNIFVGMPNVPLGSILRWSLSGDRELDAAHGIVGTFTLTELPNGYLTGPTQPFDISTSVSTLADYIGTASELLASIDLYSTPANGGWSAYDELSPYAGKLDITYTYSPVPEPASLTLLALGALIVPLTRRNRAQPRVHCGEASIG